MSAAAGDVLGGLPQAVHGVRGDDRIGDVHALQQVAQGGDLVALGRHRELTDDRACGVVERGHQVRGTGRGAGTAHGLAVEGDDASTGQVSDSGGHPSGQPGVQVVGVQLGQGAPDRGLRGKGLVGADPDAGQRVPGRVVGPFSNREEGPRAGQHRRLRQGEHRRQVVPYPARVARVRYLGEHLHQRSTGQSSGGR